MKLNSLFAAALVMTFGTAAGQSIIDFSALWGLKLEAISFPDGMAYEAGGGAVL